MVHCKEQKPFLNAVYSSVSKNTALRLSRAIRDTRAGARTKRLAWPHYNRWASEWFSLEYDEPHKGYRLEPGRIVLHLGTDETGKRLSLTLPLAEPRPAYVKPTNIRALRIVHEHGIYYAVLTVSRNLVNEKPLSATPRVVALDPGHIHPVVGFDTAGTVTVVSRPTFPASLDHRIDEVRSKRDHCRRRSVLQTSAGGKPYWLPSRRWRYYDQILQKLLRQRRDQTKTWAYTVANGLYHDYDVVSLGNYAPHGGGRSKGERRSVNNRSLVGPLRRTLSWVALRSGKQFCAWDERGSTRTCFSCGHKVDGGIPPSIRAWTCPLCGTPNHRDANAARHGLVRSLATLHATHGTLPSSGHHEISSWRTWRLTEAGITQVIATPESAVALLGLPQTPGKQTVGVVADHQNLLKSA